MNQNMKEVNDVVMDLIHSAQNDQKLKESFISNPQTVIESNLGKKLNLPEDHSIFVEDQSDPSIIYINIPRQVDVEDFELTEEDLEQIAGGSTPLCYVAAAAVIGGATYGIAYLAGRYL